MSLSQFGINNKPTQGETVATILMFQIKYDIIGLLNLINDLIKSSIRVYTDEETRQNES